MPQTTTYDAILFRQRPASPVQVVFVAPSTEIDAWARVPTKRTGSIRNFQRAEISRHIQEVQAFFKIAENTSPTAIVIGFEPSRAKESVRLVRPDGSALDPSTIKADGPVQGKISISWEPVGDPQTPEEWKHAIVSLRGRLQGLIVEELRDISGLTVKSVEFLLGEFEQRARDGKPELSSALEAEAEEEIEPDDIGGQEGEQAEELSEEAGAHLKGLSPSEKQIVIGRLEFLARLQDVVLDTVPQPELTDVCGEIVNELKPALIIDGQHRVQGTKDVGRIPFLVCALPGGSWPELAFQFIVTNHTARRVQESLLISIVGNSLSKKQRSDLEERLREAGIRVGLIEAVMRVHEDDSSPFYRLLSFGLKNESGFLDAAAMRGKVVKLWYERQWPVDILFDHFCEGRLKRDRTDNWKSLELWYQYFVAFWSAVRERYVGSEVFSVELRDGEPVSPLMRATVLRIFQDTILENIHDYVQAKELKESVPVSQTIKNEAAFTQLVNNTLKLLTPEFFQGWTITGFDGSKGAREDLRDAMLQVIQARSTVAKLKDPDRTHRLYKVQT